MTFFKLFFVSNFFIGINPNGTFYNLEDMREAIKSGIGYTPGIRCNVDASNNSQLYEIFLCVDSASGSNLIECSVFPNDNCASEIEFPSFDHNIEEKAHSSTTTLNY